MSEFSTHGLWRPFLEGKTFEIKPLETVRYSFTGCGNILVGIDFFFPTKRNWKISVIGDGRDTVFSGNSEQLKDGKLDISRGYYAYQINNYAEIFITNPSKQKKQFSFIIRKLVLK